VFVFKLEELRASERLIENSMPPKPGDGQSGAVAGAKNEALFSGREPRLIVVSRAVVTESET
jgi:hypothetical protein